MPWYFIWEKQIKENRKKHKRGKKKNLILAHPTRPSGTTCSPRPRPTPEPCRLARRRQAPLWRACRHRRGGTRPPRPSPSFYACHDDTRDTTRCNSPHVITSKPSCILLCLLDLQLLMMLG